MRLQRFLRGLKRPANAREDALWPRALAGGRALATALTLMIFVAALTVNDLRLYRFQAAFWGAGLAAMVFGFAPPFFAGRLLSRAMADAPETPGTWLEGALMRRRAVLALCVVLLIGWLIFFSGGRTPRW